MNTLSDNELLEELNKRFRSSTTLLLQQKKLLQELERVNLQLLDSEKVKSQFLSNIRNEIKNPLTAILGLSSSLPNHFNDEDAVIRKSKLIYQEAFELNYQLNNIFIAAELEAGKLIPEISYVNIKELIDQVIEELKHKAKKKNLSILFENNLENQFYRTDAEKLHTILNNLITNAIEFSTNEQHIIVHLNAVEEELCITVQDFGIGIKLEDQSKIYDRFKQLDSGSTKEFGGHGLGLSIVKELLELIGGKIALKSELNSGSSFSICIQEAEAQNNLNQTHGGNEFIFEVGDELF